MEPTLRAELEKLFAEHMAKQSIDPGILMSPKPGMQNIDPGMMKSPAMVPQNPDPGIHMTPVPMPTVPNPNQMQFGPGQRGSIGTPMGSQTPMADWFRQFGASQ